MLRQEQFKALSDFGINICDVAVLEFISTWIKENKKKNKNYKDGKYWTYNSNEAISDYFGSVISSSSVFRSLKRLVQNGLLIKGNYNKLPFDRTGWYSLTDEAETILLNVAKKEPTGEEDHYSVNALRAEAVVVEEKKEPPKSRLPFEYDVDFRKEVGRFFKNHQEVDPGEFIAYCYDLSQRLTIDNPRMFFQKKITNENCLADFKAIKQRNKNKELKPEPYQIPEEPPKRTEEEEELINRAFADLQEKFKGVNQ